MAKWMCVLCLLALGVTAARPAAAQELEPGAYAVAPKGLNVFVLANTFSFGDLAFDPAGPISDASARINTTSAGLAHMTSLFGRSAQLSVGVPIVAGHLEGFYIGEAAEVTRAGLGDPRVRVGVNLYGAPAMDRKTFATYRQRRLIGASLTVSIPLGRYSQDRLINIGAHRWALKPELALSARWASGRSRCLAARGSSAGTTSSIAAASAHRRRLRRCSFMWITW